MRYVLDASAVLALILREPGADQVAAILGEAVMSAVNESETIAKVLRHGPSREEAVAIVAAMRIPSIAFDSNLARATAWLEPLTRPAGLSLADRSCLALAKSLSAPVLTADRAWARIADVVGVRVQLIR